VQLASRVFYGGESVATLRTRMNRPDYILVDRALKDGAQVALPRENVVFENERVEIYQISPIVTPKFDTSTATNLR
jgi:hypothetical protein